jgi:hypothetical protein
LKEKRREETMRRNILALIATLTLVGLAGAVLAQTAPAAKKPPAKLRPVKQPPARTRPTMDSRRAVPVTAATRVFILAEMRVMLASAQGVAGAAGKNDWKAAAAAAHRSGLKAFKGMPKQMMKQLPEDFRGLGRQSHMAFDAVAEAAEKDRNAAAVSAKLGEAMQYCVACHETYRFTIKK